MKKIISADEANRMIQRLSYQIGETNLDLNSIVLIGVRAKGVVVCKKLHEALLKNLNLNVQMCELDISGYRDDNKRTSEKFKIDTELTDKVVIIVDDVFYTGRTSRAAIDACIAHGRPSQIKLLCLIDRGHRELPLKLDYVGKNIPTNKNQDVRVTEVNNEIEVYLFD